MNSKADSPLVQYKLLNGTARILAQCIHDLQSARGHHTPIYNLDFSLVASTLFPGASPTTKPFLPNTREVGEWILEEYENTEPYILAVSGAMYYEFLDQLHHRVETLRFILPRYDSGNFETMIRKELLQPSAQLISNLLLLTSKGREVAITQPAERLLVLLRSQKLKGLGDFVQLPGPANLAEIKIEFDRIVHTQKQLRLTADLTAGRSEQDSMFHYKMDAINICLSRFFAKDLHSKTLFVTPSINNLKSCEIDHDLVGRHMFVPLFLKNAHLLEQTRYLPDMLAWLIESLERCEDLKRKLEPYLSVDDVRLVAPVFLNQLNTFYREYYGLLTRTRKFDALDMRHEAQEELSEIVSSRSKFREEVAATIVTARQAANKIKEQESLFGVSYLEEFGMEADPIYQKITNELIGRNPRRG